MKSKNEKSPPRANALPDLKIEKDPPLRVKPAVPQPKSEPVSDITKYMPPVRRFYLLPPDVVVPLLNETMPALMKRAPVPDVKKELVPDLSIIPVTSIAELIGALARTSSTSDSHRTLVVDVSLIVEAGYDSELQFLNGIKSIHKSVTTLHQLPFNCLVFTSAHYYMDTDNNQNYNKRTQLILDALFVLILKLPNSDDANNPNLGFKDFEFNEYTMQHLCARLRDTKHLKGLVFEGCKLLGTFGAQLFPVISLLQLQVLKLIECDVYTSKELEDLLLSSNDLRTVCLDNNPISDVGVAALFKAALRTSAPLERFELSRTKLLPTEGWNDWKPPTFTWQARPNRVVDELRIRLADNMKLGRTSLRHTM